MLAKGTAAGLLAMMALLMTSAPPQRAALTVYDEGLGDGWADWSWSTTVNLTSSGQAYSGSTAIEAVIEAAWGGLYLHADETFAAGEVESVDFTIHPGASGGQSLQLVLMLGGSAVGTTTPITPSAGSWQQLSVPVDPTLSWDGLVWQDAAGTPQPQFFLDAVFLQPGTPSPTPTPGPGPVLSIDASQVLHPINPQIYGMSFADEALAEELELPLRRWGGNSTTRYNWQTDVQNRAFDWFFENIPNSTPDPSALPDGSATDLFVEQDRRTGTTTWMTVPMIGFTPTDRSFECGFRVSRYGPQEATDPWQPDCGNGRTPAGSPITGNDPADTSTVIGPEFVEQWIGHLTGRYGSATDGGVAMYALDNEPMLWSDTHRDVHPDPVGYDELRDRTILYAQAVKAADPTALVLGPAAWGWTAYFYSALDWSAGGDWWNNPLDRLAHGDVPLVAWYLRELEAWEQLNGQRLLDGLDLHFYPPGVALSPAGDANTQAWRLRSTRLLWDPTYVEESWINEPVELIPRMRRWVDTEYPGTGLALGEYNWGALDHLNGALAQADVLGIFGQEGLDRAALWDPPSSTDPGAFAFRVYRNYDGFGHRFGGLAVAASSSDRSHVATYAALGGVGGALTVVMVNTTVGPLDCTLELTGFVAADAAQRYQYSDADLTAIVRQQDLTLATPATPITLPQQSITLLVVPPDPDPSGLRGDCRTTNTIDAADLAAAILELADGDATAAAAVAGGSFPGDPIGCDANADGAVLPSDVDAITAILFADLSHLR